MVYSFSEVYQAFNEPEFPCTNTSTSFPSHSDTLQPVFTYDAAVLLKSKKLIPLTFKEEFSSSTWMSCSISSPSLVIAFFCQSHFLSKKAQLNKSTSAQPFNIFHRFLSALNPLHFAVPLSTPSPFSILLCVNRARDILPAPRRQRRQILHEDKLLQSRL